MTYQGEPLPKRVMQGALGALGYKLVRLKAYERQMNLRPARKTSYNKLFCIGFNKTATTSLEEVLRRSGLRLPKQLEQERLLAPVIESDCYERLRGFIADYDAFQDLPFSMFNTYILCDALFPGSKFILTSRDPDTWVDSYIRHYRTAFGLQGDETLTEDSFHGKVQYLERGYVHRVMRRLLIESHAGQPVVRWDLAFDRDFLIDIYQRRNAEIRSYFKQRPGDLMELDLSAESDTGRLLGFLGIDDQPPGAYPRLNAA